LSSGAALALVALVDLVDLTALVVVFVALVVFVAFAVVLVALAGADDFAAFLAGAALALVAALVPPLVAFDDPRAAAGLAAAFFFADFWGTAVDRDVRGISHLGGPAIGGASG
jgi:hypothetical protein